MRKYKINNPEHLEQIVNDTLGLSITQGSGSVKGNGDGIGKDSSLSTYAQLLNDSKFTDKTASSVSVLRKDWDKTEAAAQRYGRIPMMTRGDLSGRIFVIMDLDDFSYIYRKSLEFEKGNTDA